MSRQLTLIGLIYLLNFSNVFSQNLENFNLQITEDYLSNLIKDEDPGIAVGIVHQGEIIFEKYLGYANLEHKVKVDEKTTFNIASNAKQFTALCVLSLIREDKIKLTDDIRDYLPELYPNFKGKITIASLLNHTSGIRDYYELLALQGITWWKSFVDNTDAFELITKQESFNFQPGSDFLYSNSNYILLTEIIARVSGIPFNEFSKSLFSSLEMPNTTYVTHYGKIIPNRSRPYGNWGEWIDEPTVTEIHGDGALYTNLRDQLRWESIIQVNDDSILSNEIIKLSQKPVENEFPGYGFGLMFDSINDVDYNYHIGATSGYNATFLRLPFENYSIVVMTNNRNINTTQVTWDITYSIFENLSRVKKYPSNPEAVEPFVDNISLMGYYKSEDGNVIKIVDKDGLLYREMYQREPSQLIREKGSLFKYESIENLKMNFRNIGKSDQYFTLYKSSQEPIRYNKLSEFNSNYSSLQELEGSYFNKETNTLIEIKVKENNSISLTKNGRERQAELIMKDYLRMMSTYEFMVKRDDRGNVNGLYANNTRIKNVYFEKLID